MPQTRAPGKRAGLTRPAVLAAARELLAEGGVDRLSMRSVAQRLGVAPNALYSHVPNKTALLDDVLDDVLTEVLPPDPAASDPLAAITALMTSTYDVLVAHADLVPLFLARQGARGPNATRLGDVLDHLLGRAAVPAAEITSARRALIVHAIGSAAFASGPGEADRPIPAREAARQFTLGLSWLLLGLAQATRV
ncbi:helix-turn-helix domain-containing protein [Asanoa sp. NPDC049573]|uniref:TetR/AcrR family transcriptional regulator n=1 Tax=Asanoa sp. NPDC049573 TaxID=3155396 RepID=UPI003413C6A5